MMKRKGTRCVFVVLFLFAILVLPIIAHEEEAELVEEVEEELSIRGYNAVFVRPEKLRVNEELRFVLHVRDSAGKFVSGLNVQGQMMNAAGKDIFYAGTKEVRAGHYVFLWKPSFAGSYFVQFVFRSAEGEMLKPTFKLSVEDSRATYILFGTIVAAVLSVFVGLYCSFSQKGKKRVFHVLPLVQGVGAGLILVVLGYSAAYFYQQGGEKGFVVCGAEGCELAVHWHAELEMSVCGKEFDLPLEAGDLNKQHTHKERNKLHFHATLRTDESGGKILDPEKLFVGQLFGVLKIPFTEKCFGTYCLGDSCTDGKKGVLKVLVNGVSKNEYQKYVWKDGDKIQIMFSS